jgi:hypothetical protein
VGAREGLKRHDHRHSGIAKRHAAIAVDAVHRLGGDRGARVRRSDALGFLALTAAGVAFMLWTLGK